MLEVQKFLLDGNTHQDLNDAYGIVSAYHNSEPLVVLNYDQIDSPKFHPIPCECRGLILHKHSHELVARAFGRFFNWNEIPSPVFNFDNFSTTSKEDGSLILIYYFNNSWRINTRGSFGYSIIEYTNYTWHQLAFEALGIKSFEDLDGILDRKLTYVCELVSLYNKVVRTYRKPEMYLLSVFNGFYELRDFDIPKCFQSPEKFQFSSIYEIISFIDKKSKEDPTYEGVVICDDQFRRFKLKSDSYVALHHLKDNGNIFNPKKMLPIILKNEVDEILAYLPEVAPAFKHYQDIVDYEFDNLVEVWQKYKDIECQKDFALNVCGKTPFTSILFDIRKQYGKEQNLRHLKELWLESERLILQRLKKNLYVREKSDFFLIDSIFFVQKPR